MSAAKVWDPALRAYVVIIEERYSPGKNVVGPFTKADAEAWRDKTKALVGWLGRSWEYRIVEIQDPSTFGSTGESGGDGA